MSSKGKEMTIAEKYELLIKENKEIIKAEASVAEEQAARYLPAGAAASIGLKLCIGKRQAGAYRSGKACELYSSCWMSCITLAGADKQEAGVRAAASVTEERAARYLPAGAGAFNRLKALHRQPTGGRLSL